MPVERRLYDLLEVAPDASLADIKKAYKRQALKHHPDRGGSTEKFQELSSAHEVLTDESKRQIYDVHGEEGLRQASQGGSASSASAAGDIFGGAFGGLFKEFFGQESPFSSGVGGPRRPRRPRKPDDVTFAVSVTLEELFKGTVRRVKVNRTVSCGQCAGAGTTQPNAEVICPDCNGQGAYLSTRRLGPGMVQQFRQVCQTCGGQGRVVPFELVCKTCRGNKTQQESKTLDVEIPAGSHDGQRSVMRGAGDHLPGQLEGDVVFLLRAASHSHFERRGDDLISHAQITLSEALAGCKVDLQHLDGRTLRLRSKSGQVVKPGCWRRISGEGMPVFGDSKARGNLFIEFDVAFPDTLDAATRQNLVEAVSPGSTKPAKVGWLQRLLQRLPWASPGQTLPAIAAETEEEGTEDSESGAEMVTDYFLEPVAGMDGFGSGNHRGAPRSRL